MFVAKNAIGIAGPRSNLTMEPELTSITGPGAELTARRTNIKNEGIYSYATPLMLKREPRSVSEPVLESRARRNRTRQWNHKRRREQDHNSDQK
ncbi:hypothetical protein EVAR_22381_1 [Eumeta japonica]|uniref:Uncharacterized protein n=1 Tax=Eumeta variegata TaxID=151549 RepID=A0A4C1VK09_EUMVA|nr:hypothetical protein EVAR_22381_1 [Eumeta japonica]